jgi:hypothetical protein
LPYINSYEKNLLDEKLKPLMKLLMDPDKQDIKYGNIEYCFFKILCEAAEIKKRFVNLNGLAGILTTTEHEFADKVIRPYENSKLLSEWSGETLTKKLTGKNPKRKNKKRPKKQPEE